MLAHPKLAKLFERWTCSLAGTSVRGRPRGAQSNIRTEMHRCVIRSPKSRQHSRAHGWAACKIYAVHSSRGERRRCGHGWTGVPCVHRMFKSCKMCPEGCSKKFEVSHDRRIYVHRNFKSCKMRPEGCSPNAETPLWIPWNPGAPSSQQPCRAKEVRPRMDRRMYIGGFSRAARCARRGVPRTLRYQVQRHHGGFNGTRFHRCMCHGLGPCGCPCLGLRLHDVTQLVFLTVGIRSHMGHDVRDIDVRELGSLALLLVDL